MSPAENVDLNSIGVVLVSNGEVFLKSDSGMRQVETGSSVYRGEELITGAGSNVEIHFVDDTLLSQGADSSISLDNYVFDDSADSTPELLFNMSQGTFRMVTGKIAEQNPERFKVGSPLATIGIRGTITVHEIGPDGEKHGVEEIHSGKALLVQSIDGQLRQIASPRALVDIAPSGLMSAVRPMTVQEFEQFQSVAPAAIQAEKEIIEQREQEEQDQQDQQDQEEQEEQEEAAPVEGQGDEVQAGEQGEAESQPVAVEGVFGGEIEGGPVVAEVVMAPGVDIALAGFAGLEELFSPELVEDALAAGQDVVVPLEQGGVNITNEHLEQLIAAIDDSPPVSAEEDLLIDVIETAAAGDIPEALENITIGATAGVNFITGSSEADDWGGTVHTDYYRGLGGDDIISGYNGNDTLLGDEGNDTIYGANGKDVIDGGPGDDLLAGGNGDDTMYGATGNDTVSYDGDLPVEVSLLTGIATGDGTDTLFDIENIIGSTKDDILTGNNDEDNTISGGEGDDIINGLSGNDTASYVSADSAVNVSLVSGAVNSGGDGNDTLISIENLIGSEHNDTLKGDAGSNTLIGGVGSDTLTGGVGGGEADYFYYTSLSEGGDIITDFDSNSDKFKFINDSNGGDFCSDATFATVSTPYDGSGADLGVSAAFVYDDVLNKLWYDSNGDGADGKTLIATISGGDDVVSGDIDIGAVA